MKRLSYCWLEEFSCGCTNVTELKCDRLTYCPKHGNDALRIVKISARSEDGKTIELGLAS